MAYARPRASRFRTVVECHRPPPRGAYAASIERLRNRVKACCARRLDAPDDRQRIRRELIGSGALRLSALLGGLPHIARIAELHALSRASRITKTLLLDGKRRRHHGHVVAAGRDQGAGAFTKMIFGGAPSTSSQWPKPIRCSIAGSRMLRDLLRGEGVEIGRQRVARMMKRMGIAALYRRTNISKPTPCVPRGGCGSVPPRLHPEDFRKSYAGIWVTTD